MKVAVYTIALNEATHAERWANSAIDADHRIVADTGSSDDTVEQLTKAGVTVHRIAVRPWRFDIARNAAMALIPAQVDVCLSMDMDEFLAPGWRPKLEAAWTAETTTGWCRKVLRSSIDDATPLKTFPVKNFHHRWGFRFRRPVHEELTFTGDNEVARDFADISLYHVQDRTKGTRNQYLPLMELAHKEDPQDAQICFWLGRDYMGANRFEEGCSLLQHYLSLPNSTWREERSEAMRYLARMQPDKRTSWLEKARAEAPHRREVWLDLAEELHRSADWRNLFWACTNGIEKTRPTGSYLDDNQCWGSRLFDLGAIAAWHLNAMDCAVEWSQKAVDFDPNDPRLKRNFHFFNRQRTLVALEACKKSGDLPNPSSEEAWYAKLQDARCLRELNDEGGFARMALEAFRMRPHRAEPLIDLVRHYLRKSRGDIAIRYAEAGLALTLPEHDTLGVEPQTYTTGLKEAYTIAASYSKDEAEKERGRAICNWLSLDREVPDSARGLARHNSRWYVVQAKSLMPSIQFCPLSLAAPDGYKPGNVSIARSGEGFIALIRSVNYDLLESGYFDRHGDTSFRQRTIAAYLDHRFQVISTAEVLLPDDIPTPQHLDSLGFEDPRPFIWRNALWCLTSVRQLNKEGRAEMVLARIKQVSSSQSIFIDWRVLPSGMPSQWEKNWMPQQIGDGLRFIYSVDPTRILSDKAAVLFQEPAAIAAENFRGGSQAIPFDDGWLMLIHEWQLLGGRRNYFHRFIWLDAKNRLTRLSHRFFFVKIASEFASGLAWHVTNEHLVISFGINDHEPTIAVVNADDVRAVLLSMDDHRLASVLACEASRPIWEALQKSE